jgi:inorganic pyrophosphatase
VAALTRYPDWIYPLDYGFIPGTVGGDGHPVDVFVGTEQTGLRAALVVRHDDVEELKLLWNMSDEEASKLECS